VIFDLIYFIFRIFIFIFTMLIVGWKC